jgi:elongation factor Ts
MQISAAQVKELRERTGVGMMDCKKALVECDGDINKAIKFLRERGIAAAARRAGRTTKEGVIFSYIHPGNRIGVLVEVNCETDFVARNEQFQQFAKDIAMHIAASSPRYIQREDVPVAEVEAEREVLTNQAQAAGRPEKVLQKIVDGRLDKFFEQICLLEQPFIKDPNLSIRDLLRETIARIGENIVIRRFARYQLGEELS